MKSSNKNLSDFIKPFLNMQSAENSASKNTIDSYNRDLKNLPSKLLEQTPQQISEEDIKKYFEGIKEDFKPSTISRKISSLRQFFHFLVSEEIIDKNPARVLEFPRKGRSLPKFLTQSEIEAIILEAEKEKGFKGARAIALIEVLKGSGLRISEAIKLKKNSVQAYEIEGKESNFLLIKGKGDKERITPISKNSLNKINEYLKYLDMEIEAGNLPKSNFLFPSKTAKSGYITRQQAANIIKFYAVSAGIDANKISPHKLRHSFATNLLEKGLDIRVLQEVLGHSDISTTQIYTHLNVKKLKNFIEENHPLSKKKQ